MAYTTPREVFNEMQRTDQVKESFSNVSSGDTLELDNHFILKDAYPNKGKSAIVTVGGVVQSSSDYTIDFKANEIEYNGTDTGDATVQHYYAPLPSPTVEDIISDVEDDIDEATNSTYDGTVTVTDEIYDGTAFDGQVYVFQNRPVQNVSKVELNRPDSGGPNPNYETIDEGLGNDYTEHKNLGIRFLKNGANPSNDPEDVRVTYDYGSESVPGQVNRLATIMTINYIARGMVEGAIVDGRDNFDPQTVSTYDAEIARLKNRLTVERMANFTNLAVPGTES